MFSPLEIVAIAAFSGVVFVLVSSRVPAVSLSHRAGHRHLEKNILVPAVEQETPKVSSSRGVLAGGELYHYEFNQEWQLTHRLIVSQRYPDLPDGKALGVTVTRFVEIARLMFPPSEAQTIREFLSTDLKKPRVGIFKRFALKDRPKLPYEELCFDITCFGACEIRICACFYGVLPPDSPATDR